MDTHVKYCEAPENHQQQAEEDSVVKSDSEEEISLKQ
jgi:hypothetical protein